MQIDRYSALTGRRTRGGMYSTTDPAGCLDKNVAVPGSKSRLKAVFAFPGRRFLHFRDVEIQSAHCREDPADPHLRRLFAQILVGVLHRLEDGMPAVFEPAAPFGKFFTAPILPNFASADDSVACQHSYHRALQLEGPGVVDIINGYYDARRARAHRYLEQCKPRDSERVDIWRLEEKQSDVALAVHALADALEAEVDHLVFVSNDTDLVPALQLIRMKTAAVVGLVIPTRPGERKPNAGLCQYAHWTRKQIADEELAVAQLATPVMDGHHPIHKPLSWYDRPDLLAPIFAEAKRVRRSAGAAWKWLQAPNQHLDGRVPLSMCANDEGAQQLREYMAQYARDFDV